MQPTHQPAQKDFRSVWGLEGKMERGIDRRIVSSNADAAAETLFDLSHINTMVTLSIPACDMQRVIYKGTRCKVRE